jgi:glycosyltransferase involved in cell wall biosynthesis
MSASPEFSVDVIIPTWNSANFLEAAALSVLNQTYLPEQLIIIDDGSTDHTAEIAQRIIANNKTSVRIMYHRQENAGPSSARNKGIGFSTAPFLAFLDSDDIWYPIKLEKQIDFFRNPSFPDLALLFCEYDSLDEQGQKQDSLHVTHIRTELRGHVFHEMTTANYISGSGSAVMLKKSCLEKTGDFDTKLGAYEDWDMWLRIARDYAIDYIREPLAGIRRHSSNMQTRHEHMNENSLLFYKKWISVIENKESIHYWAFAIAKLVLNPVYKPEVKKKIELVFTKAELRKLYFRTGGSFDLYLLLKRLIRALKGSR